ncbi:MAG: cyclopropane fatty acyl phospholipid synthase [Steroidobacteraceae bacterium]
MSATIDGVPGPARRPARFERFVRDAFAGAGVEIGGARPWDVLVHDRRLYSRVALEGTLGLGEAYMDGWWDCADLGEFFRRVITWRNARSGDWRLRVPSLVVDAMFALRNLQSRARARHVIDAHYDLPAGLYERMLGPHMSYSCAYWKRARTLDEAQRAKLDLICRKLELAPGLRLLDLGCGFGSVSRHAAEHYGCEVVAVTLSEEQARYAKTHCAGLPVSIHVCDYRDVDAYAGDRPFDRIANIAMFEAIGRRNARGFMAIVRRLLAADGLWLLHTIGADTDGADPWLHRYIFPNGELLTLERIHAAMRGHFFVEDLHNFGPDYAPTLAAWRANFLGAWDAIRALAPARFDERFRRMWVYYLECCRGAFAARNNHLWQIVMAGPARTASYQAVR